MSTEKVWGQTQFYTTEGGEPACKLSPAISRKERDESDELQSSHTWWPWYLISTFRRHCHCKIRDSKGENKMYSWTRTRHNWDCIQGPWSTCAWELGVISSQLTLSSLTAFWSSTLDSSQFHFFSFLSQDVSRISVEAYWKPSPRRQTDFIFHVPVVCFNDYYYYYYFGQLSISKVVSM